MTRLSMGRGLLASCLAAAPACGGDGDTTANPHVVRIGTLVGEAAEASDQMLAVSEINAAGGLRLDGVDHTIELIVLPHGGTLETSIEAIERFAQQDVVAVVGPPRSSLVLGTRSDHSDGVAHAAFEAGMLVVSGHATGAAISDLDDDDLMWRTVPSDEFQGEAAATYLREHDGAQTAAVLFRDDSWGRGLAERFVEVFETLEGEVVALEGYDPDQDLDRYAFPELDALFASEPHVVYLACFAELAQVSSRIVQGLYLGGLAEPPVFMAADGAYSSTLLGNAQPELLDLLLGTAPGVPFDSEDYQRFAEAYEQHELGSAEQAWPHLYDATYAVALAIQAAGSTDARDFKQHMRPISRDDGNDDVTIHVGEWPRARSALLEGQDIDYEGASGPIDFTQNGDPELASYILWRTVPNGQGGYAFQDVQDLAVHAR